MDEDEKHSQSTTGHSREETHGADRLRSERSSAMLPGLSQVDRGRTHRPCGCPHRLRRPAPVELDSNRASQST